MRWLPPTLYPLSPSFPQVIAQLQVKNEELALRTSKISEQVGEGRSRSGRAPSR